MAKVKYWKENGFPEKVDDGKHPLPVPKAVTEAAERILTENERCFEEGLDSVKRRLDGLSLEEKLKIASGEMELPTEVDDDDDDYDEQNVGQEVYHRDQYYGDVDDDCDGSWWGDHQLPCPNPWRLVDLSDPEGSWLAEWKEEVRKNKEYIEFMEFRKMMNKLETMGCE